MIAAVGFFEFTHYIDPVSINTIEFFSWFGVSSAIVMILGLGLAGMVFDLMSVVLTWWLVKKAASAKSLPTLWSHLALDVFVAVLSMLWMLIVWNGRACGEQNFPTSPRGSYSRP